MTSEGRISVIADFVFLPLLHILVEERAGVRRFHSRFGFMERRFDCRVPLSLSLSPLGGARERRSTISNEFARK
jgi:hypothetical protein